MWVIVRSMKQHQFLKFDLSTPSLCTYPPKVGHAHFPPKRTLYEEILIIFVMFQLPIYHFLCFFWLLSSKMMLKRQSDEPFFIKQKTTPKIWHFRVIFQKLCKIPNIQWLINQICPIWKKIIECSNRECDTNYNYIK